MEWQLAIPPQSKEEVKRDWSITQRAWWDAILMMEAEPSTVRIALEMRIMGGSDALLAPQRGNDLGTACVDIVTTLNTPPDNWAAFCQRLTDKWVSYKDPSTGERLRARPHWCKQWSFLTLPDDRGLPLKATEWFRKVGYRDEIPLFIDALTRASERMLVLRSRTCVPDLPIRTLKVYFGGRRIQWSRWYSQIISSRGVINKIKKWIRGCFS